MIPASFDYHSPQSLEEALSLLQSHRDDVKVLSGGQSLLPLLKLRLGAAGHLVDIGRIPDLEYIREEGGVLKIGGRTRESALERSDLIQAKYPLLAETAAVIADPIVRNLATVGGNLAHGDPANDHPATMLALRAEVVATGPGGTRTIPIDQFFLGLFAAGNSPAADANNPPDPTKDPTVYWVAYSHLDTQWRWTYPQVISQFIPGTVLTNAALISKYPNYVFNWTGANRYRLLKEYYPPIYSVLSNLVKQGRWFPAGS